MNKIPKQSNFEQILRYGCLQRCKCKISKKSVREDTFSKIENLTIEVKEAESISIAQSI